MPAPLFYLFALVAVAGALGVVINRNPVSSAFCMIGSFLGVAALFIGLNAYFIATIQILVYAGAIMVLFLFIIMLLDIRAEKLKNFPFAVVGGGVAAAIAFFLLTSIVITKSGIGEVEMPKIGELKELKVAYADGERVLAEEDEAEPEAKSDVQLVGYAIFTNYNFLLQIIGVLLLVSTVGVVVLSKKNLT